MDGIGDLADRVPDFGIGVIQIELVADHPHQHCRMRRRLSHLRKDPLSLLSHRGCIVVIKAIPRVAHFDADRYFQAVTLCAVEQGALTLRVRINAPGTKCIAAALPLPRPASLIRKGRHPATGDSRPLPARCALALRLPTWGRTVRIGRWR